MQALNLSFKTLLLPTIFTLFPYTTLFRSHKGDIEPLFVQTFFHGLAENLRPVALQKVVESIDVQDRKSTRLNSSHTVISYAVFCLKKKHHEDVQTVDYGAVVKACKGRLTV